MTRGSGSRVRRCLRLSDSLCSDSARRIDRGQKHHHAEQIAVHVAEPLLEHPALPLGLQRKPLRDAAYVAALLGVP